MFYGIFRRKMIPSSTSVIFQTLFEDPLDFFKKFVQNEESEYLNTRDWTEIEESHEYYIYTYLYRHYLGN